MASSIDTQQVLSRNAITHYVDAPGATTAHDVAWVDMRDFDSIVISYLRTSGTDVLDTFAVIGNPESDGSGTDVTIKTITAVPDAVGDYAFAEVSAQEITAEGDDTRYVSLSLQNATAGDTGAVTYLRTRAHRPAPDLTADSIA